MKKFLFKRTLKITASALLIFSILCTMFSVIAVTDIVKDNPIKSYSAVSDIAQAQADSTYSLAWEDVLAQETAAVEAYAYSYDSVSYIAAAEEAKVLSNNSLWNYSYIDVAEDTSSGLRLPVAESQFTSLDIWGPAQGYTPSKDNDVNATLTKMLSNWNVIGSNGEGLAVYNSKVVTYVGKGSKASHASALGFVAPETGKIHIKPTTFAALSAGKPFWSLQNAAETVGVIIYKNGKKIWPTDSDYYTLTNTTRSVTTPDISVEVASGDGIYFTFIPLTEGWGYFSLNPQITYQRIGAAVDYAWSYSEKDVALDETSGLWLPTGNWTQPELYHVAKISDDNRASGTFPNYLTKGEKGNLGIGSYADQRDIITFIDETKVTGITYIAPKDGVVMIHDKDGTGKIEGMYWGLSAGGNYKLGLAVYKNEEKIFPADDSFITTTKDIAFPVVSDISVKAGDKITFAIIPLGGESYTFAHFSPQVTYQTLGAVANSVWSYSESATVTEEGTGYNVASGEWQELLVGRGHFPSNDEKLRGEAYLKNWLYVSGTNNGIGVYDNKIISFMGKNATALTYTAPIAGNIHLYDPKGGSIGTAAKGDPFWMLDKETVGISIYQNNTKVWPADSNYYVLNSATSSVKFPDLTLSVAAGDEIRVAIHPLMNCNWGYMLSGAPQVDYISATYSSAAAAVAYQETKDKHSQFVDTLWSYEEKSIEQTTVNVDGEDKTLFMPTGDWFAPAIFKGGYPNRDEAVRNAVPNMFYIWQGGGADTDGSGLASYEGRVVTFVGSGNKAAPTLTYTAPLTGSVKISSDDLIGRIDGRTFITLHEDGMIGFAIYKNNEKIWPAEGDIGDFHVFNGQVFDSATGTYSDEGNVHLEAPEIDIDVNVGDKIRFMFVAMEGYSWGFMALDPHIQYTAIDGWGDTVTDIYVKAPSVKKYFAIEEYDFSDMSVSLLKADGTSVTLSDTDYTIDASKEIGINTVTVNYVDGNTVYKKTFDVRVIETLYGDLDMSGSVDGTDLSNLRKYLLGVESDIHRAVTDVTDDGDTNIIDLVRMKRHLADSDVILGPITD